MAARFHNAPTSVRPEVREVENPEEEPFPTTKEELKRALAQKIEERNRICATLDQEIETMKRSLGQTVNPVAGGKEENEVEMQREYLKRRDASRETEQRVAAGRARTAAEKRARESAAWHASYYGGRRTRRKSQSRKKLSKTRRKRKNRKTKKRRRRKSCKRCKKKRRE